MSPFWYAYVDRIRPPPYEAEFDAVSFTLDADVNLRLALKAVDPDASCWRHADVVRQKTESYARLRAGKKSRTVLADALRDLDDALWRLTAAMRNCPYAKMPAPLADLAATGEAALEAVYSTAIADAEMSVQADARP
ncbi:hypothetical protein [Rhizobium binxianense]